MSWPNTVATTASPAEALNDGSATPNGSSVCDAVCCDSVGENRMPQLPFPSPAPLLPDWSTTGKPARAGSRPHGEPDRPAASSVSTPVKWSTWVGAGGGVLPGVGG